jgi:hypothetical protein
MGSMGGRVLRRGGIVLLLASAAICMALSGCDFSPPAATVNGVSITRAELDARLSDAVQSPYARCVLELQGSFPNSVTGVGGSTVDSQFASDELSTLVLSQLIVQELGRRHRPVTASALSAAREDLVAELESSISSTNSLCPPRVTARQLLRRASSAISSQEVHFLAEVEQLAVEVTHLDLSTSALARYYFANASDFAEVCLSDIAVGSEAQALSILGAISSGGATFAAEARQSSTDAQTAQGGGVLGCFPSSELQSSATFSGVSSLARGQISQPIETTTSSGGTVWLLLQLNSRTEMPFAQVRSQIRLVLLGGENAAVSRELGRVIRRAQVTVDPRYGTWNGLKEVMPPVSPPAKDLLSPSADEASGSSPAIGG